MPLTSENEIIFFDHFFFILHVIAVWVLGFFFLFFFIIIIIFGWVGMKGLRKYNLLWLLLC